jgi:hypothetical protein
LLPAHLRGPGLRENHDATPGDERDADDPEIAQRSGHEVTCQEPDDRDGQTAPDDEPAEPIVERAAYLGLDQAPPPRRHDAHDVLEEVDNDGGDRAHLDDRGVGRHALVVDGQAEHLFGDGQVAGARDRQELGEPLDDSEHECVEIADVRHW